MKQRTIFNGAIEAAQSLMDFFKTAPCKVWDATCGDGDMTKVYQEYGHIVSSSPAEVFLKSTCEADVIIAVPPLKDSEDFIRHALGITTTVVMLLKAQYWYTKAKYNLFLEHVPAFILPLTWKPTFKGQPAKESTWCVWKEDAKETIYRPLSRPSITRWNK